MPDSVLQVLLVEDNPADAVLFAQSLGTVEWEGRGFGVLTAASLAEAFGTMASTVVDIIVLDLSLPDSHGLATFEAVAERAGITPIVVHSGLDDEHVAIHAVRRGAQDYLVKGHDAGPALAEALAGAVDRKWAEAELAHLDNFHPHTGLPRRGLLERRVAGALGRADRAGTSLPLIHLELDGLDAIAATLGASVADGVRRAAAERLAAGLRSVDTLGHASEHGFAVVAESLGAGAEAAGLASRMLDAVARPFTIDDVPIVTEGRVGIGLLPADGRNPGEALGNARAAARRAPAGSFAYCDAEMTQLTQRRQALLDDLPAAIAADELVLHFQPLVSGGRAGADPHGAVGSVEALMRWQHPAFGLVSPGEFIPLAEESGLIVELGSWALRAACRQLRDWDRAGLPQIGMAVNVSPRQFASDRLLPAVEDALAAGAIAPERLELEVTESTIADPELTATTLGSLRRLGVTVAIDDFGTGFSSLAYLRRLGVGGENVINTLKIDRSFVSELGVDAHAGGIVTAILGLARQLELSTVAEGVETEAQAGFLSEQGCDKLQGFRICRPLPGAEASEWLGAHAAAVAA